MIPIFKPYMPVDIVSDIQTILYSGQLSYGKFGKSFEKVLGDYLHNDICLSTSSHNHAMLVAISTLGLKAGDEVIASPVSCLASNQPFAVRGIDVVWADVNPETGLLSPEDVLKKIGKRTKAIVHNHFCGYVGASDEILKIAKAHGIPVVDDCIEAFGSEFSGQIMGNTGSDITVFSFQAVRLPNTIDGGALIFRDRELFEKAKLIRDYGIDRDHFRDSDNEIDANCDIRLAGYGATMSEISSYIGLKQMQEVDALLGRQRSNAKFWDRLLEHNQTLGYSPLPVSQVAKPNYWVYGLLASDSRACIRKFRSAGIYATAVHVNNNRYSVFGRQPELKGVEEFMKHFVAVPSGWWVDQGDLEKAVESMVP